MCGRWQGEDQHCCASETLGETRLVLVENRCYQMDGLLNHNDSVPSLPTFCEPANNVRLVVTCQPVGCTDWKQ
jgi:hypothetical protein